jgi:hypothetical protein
MELTTKQITDLLSLTEEQIIDMDLSAKVHWANGLGLRINAELTVRKDVAKINAYLLNRRANAVEQVVAA